MGKIMLLILCLGLSLITPFESSPMAKKEKNSFKSTLKSMIVTPEHKSSITIYYPVNNHKAYHSNAAIRTTEAKQLKNENITPRSETKMEGSTSADVKEEIASTSPKPIPAGGNAEHLASKATSKDLSAESGNLNANGTLSKSENTSLNIRAESDTENASQKASPTEIASQNKKNTSVEIGTTETMNRDSRAVSDSNVVTESTPVLTGKPKSGLKNISDNTTASKSESISNVTDAIDSHKNATTVPDWKIGAKAAQASKANTLPNVTEATDPDKSSPSKVSSSEKLPEAATTKTIDLMKQKGDEKQTTIGELIKNENHTTPEVAIENKTPKTASSLVPGGKRSTTPAKTIVELLNLKIPLLLDI